MKILIDNGHGIDTKGKRSPDGRLLEYAQNRFLAGRIVSLSMKRKKTGGQWSAKLGVCFDEILHKSRKLFDY